MDESPTPKKTSPAKAKSSISLLPPPEWKDTATIEALREIVAAACADLGVSGRSVEISLVGDAESRRINRDYLGRDYATNVISFGSDEAGELGSLVVNLDFAAREAEPDGYGQSYLVGYYVIHGLLHLAGYDHERVDESAAAAMAQKQEELGALLEPLTHNEDG